MLQENALSDKSLLVPIMYSESLQRAKLKAFSQQASDLLEVTKYEPKQDLWAEMAYALIALMAPIKNPKFCDEDEWRILRTKAEPDPDMCFRPIHGAIVPYSKISLEGKYFTRIVQGPTLHKEFGERSLRMFLRQNGLGHVEVESSDIPLRSL